MDSFEQTSRPAPQGDDTAGAGRQAGGASMPGHSILEPERQSLPLVFASPHSGRDYPRAFIDGSPLDETTLRRSEDSFVDEIFAAAPEMGAPLLRAHFPRAYVDANREAYELDPGMFEDRLPAHVTTDSARVAAGLGTIARLVSSGAEIYDRKLTWNEAETRISACYTPYHAALSGLIERTRAAHGYCILVDCHSMPSVGGPTDQDSGVSRVDMVLGDCFGGACAKIVSVTADQCLSARGYRIYRNTPYSGGFTTRHYGRPETGVHALQIEINRRLYMDERQHRRHAGLDRMATDMRDLIRALAAVPARRLLPT